MTTEKLTILVLTSILIIQVIMDRHRIESWMEGLKSWAKLSWIISTLVFFAFCYSEAFGYPFWQWGHYLMALLQ